MIQGSSTGYMVLGQKKAVLRDMAKPGLVYTLPDQGPPWLVVDHTLDRLLLTDWPLDLWRVEALDPAVPQGHTGNYTRCNGVRFVSQEPVYRLFADRRRGVVEIMNSLSHLDRKTATLLAKGPLHRRRCDRLQAKGWATWLQNVGASQSAETFGTRTRILSSPGDHPAGSPVGKAFLLTHRLVFDQAKQVDAERAFGAEEDGTPFLLKPWRYACEAVNDAILAYGAPQLFSQKERKRLCASYDRPFPMSLRTSPDYPIKTEACAFP